MPTTTTKSERLPVASDADVVLVRAAVRTAAVAAGFGLVDQTKFVTAASELARNALRHGGGGTCLIEQVTDGPRKGVRLAFEDHGPGIADVKLAMTDGYTTAGGLGLGLSGSKRLVDEFDLWSEVGRGTRVTVAKWK